jgi:hypothetical protein
MVPEVDGVGEEGTILAGDAEEVVDEGGAAEVFVFYPLVTACLCVIFLIF